MAIRERLVYAIDVVTDGANKGLANFRQSVAQAETTTGKFKAGASSAFDSIKANAGNLALAGGAALVAFGAKAVAAFQETALEAGKFSDATGLAVEDASRWLEVAGDVGVSAETIEGAFVRLNKSLATGDLKDYGLELQRTADGAVDVNATMLEAIRVIGGIQDPTRRAEAAQKAFGRSYAQAAEIIFDSADSVQKKLGEVSDAKVIDEKELEKARRFREAMDNLQDSAEDVALIVGEHLVPVLSDLAEVSMDIKSGFESIPKAPWIVQKWWDTASPVAWQRHLVDGYGKVGDAAKDLGSKVKGIFGGGDAGDEALQFADRVDRARDAVSTSIPVIEEAAEETARHRDELTIFHETVDLATAAIEMKAEADEQAAAADEAAAEAADRHREAVEAATEAMEAQRDAALELVGGDIAVRNAQRRAKEAVEELNDVLGDQETTLAQAGAAIDDAADAQLNAAAAAADYRAKQMEANGQTVDARTRAQLMKEELQKLAGQLTGPLAEAIQNYIAQLGAIPRTVGTTIVLTKPGRVGDINPFARTGGPRASGGPTSAGTVYGVLERGQPEVWTDSGGRSWMMSPSNGQVTPMQPAPAATGGGGPVTINVYPRTGDVAPEAIVDALKKYERRNGTGWRT